MTSVEKEIVAKESLFYDVVKPKEQNNNDSNKNDSNLDRNGNYTPLPNKNGEVAPQSILMLNLNTSLNFLVIFFKLYSFIWAKQIRLSW